MLDNDSLNVIFIQPIEREKKETKKRGFVKHDLLLVYEEITDHFSGILEDS